jgi:hypothetical protein
VVLGASDYWTVVQQLAYMREVCAVHADSVKWETKLARLHLDASWNSHLQSAACRMSGFAATVRS